MKLPLAPTLLLVAACAGGCSSADEDGGIDGHSTGSPAGSAQSGATGSDGGAGQGGGTGAGGTGAGAGSGGGSAGSGAEQCPAEANVGTEVGQQLPEIVVKDCDDNDVSLDDLCGASALWIFAAHGWCPLCQSVSAQAEQIHDGFSGQNVASVNVVVATGLSETPTADYCKLWRDEHGHEDVMTLYDPTGAILSLWSGSSSLSAFVSSDRVIVSKLVHDSDPQHIEDGISGALAQ